MFGFIKKVFGLGGTPLSEEDLKNAIVVDVRTPGEFRQGHVAGSRNIPLQELNDAMAELRELKTPIITCCASGMRSGVAAKRLKSAGIKAVNGGTWRKVNRILNH